MARSSIILTTMFIFRTNNDKSLEIKGVNNNNLFWVVVIEEASPPENYFYLHLSENKDSLTPAICIQVNPLEDLLNGETIPKSQFFEILQNLI